MSLHAPHDELGAVFADHGPWRLPARYGDSEAAAANEYDALRAAAGIVELGERALLRVAGPTRVRFLHGLLSNAVENLADGDGSAAALMEVKGGLVAILRVVATADHMLLELPAERLERVEGLLTHYRVAAPVRFEALPDAVLAIAGPRAGAVLRETSVELPKDAPNAHVSTRVGGAEARVVRAGDLPGGGFVLYVAPEATASVWHTLLGAGVRPVGREALDARRVEAGRPWYGFDIGERNLLHETGLLGELHSPTKGCYVGQEVVARLEARGGKVNKALRGLRLTAPAAPGAPVHEGEREIGTTTTCGVSPVHGPIAMGYVHRDAFAAGTEVTVDGHPATVVALPFRKESD